MYRGFFLAAVAPGLSPGLGPFAMCLSMSLSSCFLSYLNLSCQLSRIKAKKTRTKTKNKQTNKRKTGPWLPPIRAYMDNMEWACMKIKRSKSRGISIFKGNC